MRHPGGDREGAAHRFSRRYDVADCGRGSASGTGGVTAERRRMAPGRNMQTQVPASLDPPVHGPPGAHA